MQVIWFGWHRLLGRGCNLAAFGQRLHVGEKGSEALFAKGHFGVAGGIVSQHAVVIEERVNQARSLPGDGLHFKSAMIEVVLHIRAHRLGVGVAVVRFADEDLINNGAFGGKPAVALDETAIRETPFTDVTEFAHTPPGGVRGCAYFLGQYDGDVVGIGNLQGRGSRLLGDGSDKRAEKYNGGEVAHHEVLPW